MQRADAVGDRIFIEGNTAAGARRVYGGATVCAWYPITPSSSLAEAFAKHCAKLPRRPGDQARTSFAIVQAEDELASIGIVIGAGWNGARAFTATSGPGISLMQEFIGLAYFAEIPAVIFDVQRGGPSTGMPTRTQQSDILSCAYASHGDTKHVLLFPEDPHECFEFAAQAFDLADRLQTPIFVMLDLDIGMNDRLCKPLAWDDGRAYDRGKVMTAEELEAGKDFGRYLDVDGDGIPYRTYPGTHPTKGAFFTRGTSQRPLRALHRGRRRLRRQHAAAAAEVRDRQDAGAAPGQRQRRASRPASASIYFGSTAPAMDEALEVLEARRHPSSTRCACAPSRSPTTVADFIAAHDHVFVVEQNRDAQLRTLLVNEVRHRSGAAGPDPALRRHADHRALHRQGDQRSSRGAEGEAGEGDVMTYLAKPKLHHPRCRRTSSATRGATTKARSRRCAPAAATIRSPPRSSRPASS